MFSASELQWIFTYLLSFCLILLAAYLIQNVKSPKMVALPTSRKNNTLLYIKWVMYIFKHNSVFKNPIMNLVSMISHRYRKSGIVHFDIPFLNVVFLFHPDTVQPLLQSASCIDKPIFYHFLEEFLGLSLLVCKGERWHKRRKLLTPAFHLRILEKFLPVFEEKSKILVEKLKHYEGNGSIDIVPLVTNSVLDILCETAMGLRAKESNYDYSTYVKHLKTLLNIIQERTYAMWTWPDIIFRLTRKGRKFKRSLECLNKLTNRIIEERISLMKDEDQSNTWIEQEHCNRKQLTFLDIVLNSVSNDPDFLLEDVRNETQLFLFTGHDTSSSTIIWTLYMLGKHPDIQRRVQEEVDAVLGDNSNRILNKNDLYDLKYTECVIKETMRLYPIVPLIARKITKEIIIGEYTIPEGFTCVVSIYDQHRNPDIFPNPDLFDPERFFPENCLGRHPYAYFPFSAGPRNCIGQKFAMMEMKVTLARIMQSLTVESLDQSMETEYRLILHPKGPVRLKVKTR